MNRWLVRMGVGLALALPMAMLTIVWAAPSVPVSSAPETVSNCQTCHSEFAVSWAKSSHGMAVADPAFREMWMAQGSPHQCLSCHATGYDPATDTWQAEGVTCEACHAPVPANHPQEPAPIDRTSQACGTCHTEGLFEWQASKHRQAGLDCIHCHDPHGTQLRSADPSDLCSTCHRDLGTRFAHSAHSRQGLTCADCHLAPEEGPKGQAHSERDHSFRVSLSTCTSCHSTEMHDPGSIHNVNPTPATLDPMASVEKLQVTAAPSPVGPLGFALLSALVGMASGMVLAPWLERWYRRLNKNRNE